MKRSRAPSQAGARKRFCPPTRTASGPATVATPGVKASTSFSAPKVVAPSKAQVLARTPAPAAAAKKVVIAPHRLAANLPAPGQEATTSRYYSVVYGKVSNRKHKQFSNDGLLVLRGRTAVLKDLEGKDVARSGSGDRLRIVSIGDQLIVGGKECEVMDTVSEEAFVSGKFFLKGSVGINSNGGGSNKSAASAATMKRTGPARFRSPLRDIKGIAAPASVPVKRPLHDPDADGAVVLRRPRAPGEVAVVVDPELGRKLRPHQVDGVRFLWNCVMTGSELGNGAILADSMGLGKTVQAITLIWTMLKQGIRGHAAAKKVVIAVPATMVRQWEKEIRKWLGSHRVRVLKVESGSKNASTISDFVKGTVFPILIIGYDMFRTNAKAIAAAGVDLVICDEGHKLKNESAKTTAAFTHLGTPRRIILTGTPIQNDLDEFYCMINFVNPGALGAPAGFKRIYTQPITRAREPDASEQDRAIGRARSRELLRLTEQFILRRTSDVNRAFLPSRIEQVVLARPSPLQVELYRNFAHSKHVRDTVFGSTMNWSSALTAIMVLRKLCNHPTLVHPDAARVTASLRGDASATAELASDADGGGFDEDREPIGNFDDASLWPSDFDARLAATQHGSKMAVLMSLLAQVRSSTDDRVVVVSNSTMMLDHIGAACRTAGYPTCRLDGSVDAKTRADVVARFNNKYSDLFVFLLSAKAGGLGLTLTGGNRLVLFDPDWNPATDEQACARVWRDGQTKTVYIYRLLTTGTIEEKIFQRQVVKLGLSESIVDRAGVGGASVRFSREELKDLFTLRTDTACDTADMLASQPHDWTLLDQPQDQCEDKFLATTAPSFVLLRQFIKDETPTTTTTTTTTTSMDTLSDDDADHAGGGNAGKVNDAVSTGDDDDGESVSDELDRLSAELAAETAAESGSAIASEDEFQQQ